jgi:multidrug efflux pump subunit AcrB
MEKALLATERTPDGPPLVAKVRRTGILNELVCLLYSQERLASYGLKPPSLSNVLRARNITLAGGQVDVTGRAFAIDPSGEFRSEREIGDVTVGVTSFGTPLYLPDVVNITRANPFRKASTPLRATRSDGAGRRGATWRSQLRSWPASARLPVCPGVSFSRES